MKRQKIPWPTSRVRSTSSATSCSRGPLDPSDQIGERLAVALGEFRVVVVCHPVRPAAQLLLPLRPRCVVGGFAQLVDPIPDRRLTTRVLGDHGRGLPGSAERAADDPLDVQLGDPLGRRIRLQLAALAQHVALLLGQGERVGRRVRKGFAVAEEVRAQLDLQTRIFEVELALEDAEDGVVDLAIVPHRDQDRPLRLEQLARQSLVGLGSLPRSGRPRRRRPRSGPRTAGACRCRRLAHARPCRRGPSPRRSAPRAGRARPRRRARRASSSSRSSASSVSSTPSSWISGGSVKPWTGG